MGLRDRRFRRRCSPHHSLVVRSRWRDPIEGKSRVYDKRKSSMKIGIVICTLTAVPLFLMGIAARAQVLSLHIAPSSCPVAANCGKLPLSFEPNQGQTRARVQFLARGAGYTIFLSPTSATFALRRIAAAGRPAAESAIVRMDLLGANPDITMQPQDKLPGIANYLMGSTRAKWPTNLPTYSKTRSHNIYAGIDLVYYGAQGQLEYDFVLAPQADPANSPCLNPLFWE